MTNRTNTIYRENEIKLPQPIEPGPIYDKSQTRQPRDQSHRFGLCQNQNSTIGAYPAMCGL